ncbi:alpha/beta hydrolase [Chitinophagaceae bacterium 26-R-25]|nr:alpha/beta hydrolase [Chitinophagaceae bacterium 26-R-25]
MRNSLLFLLIALCTNYNTYSQSERNVTNIHVLTSDSVSLFVNKAGKGTPCIFVHGGPGAWSKSFEDLGGSVLEQKLTMYYFDQRGCGRSTSPAKNDYSPERMVEDIETIRKQTGENKVYLIAHSFGGILALKYAEKYPEHVKGLIMLNTTLYVDNSLLNQIAFINQTLGTHIVAPKDSVLQAFIAAKTQLRKADVEYKILSNNKAAVDKLDSVDNSEERNNSFARHVFAMPLYWGDFTKETGNVKVPVLVITGTKDNNIGPEHYKLFKFPNQQVKVIEGGHILYFENNKEFAEVVFQFVQ